MKQFKKVLNEINFVLSELMLFEIIINTALIFLLIYFVISFFDISFLYALFPAVLYFMIHTFIKVSSSKYSLVEEKYQPLREKLRTAADNIERDNVIVNELEFDVTREMKNVGISLFINPRNISYKILFVAVLSFLVILASTFDFQFPDFKKKVPDIFDKDSSPGAGDFTATELESDEDIYGDEDVAKLGSNELDIRIKPVDFKVSVKEEGEFQKREFDTIFPKDSVVKETKAFEENIPKEQQELVKKYFKKLAE